MTDSEKLQFRAGEVNGLRAMRGPLEANSKRYAALAEKLEAARGKR